MVGVVGVVGAEPLFWLYRLKVMVRLARMKKTNSSKTVYFFFFFQAPGAQARNME